MSELGFSSAEVPSRRSTRGNRVVVGVLIAFLAVLVGGGIIGYTVWMDRRKRDLAQDTMSALTRSVGAHTMSSDVRFVDDAGPRALDEWLSVTDEAAHDTDASALAIDGDTATFDLRHAYRFGERGSYVYTTKPTMEWSDGAWRVAWGASTVLPDGATHLKIARETPNDGFIDADGKPIDPATVKGWGALYGEATATKVQGPRPLVATLTKADGTVEEVGRDGGEQTPSKRPTIVPELQNAAFDITHAKGSGTAIVAIKPSTGGIVAMASDASFPIASRGKFPPGSTFKAVTALAALRQGMTPESGVTCPSSTTIGTRPYQNYAGYPASAMGAITLSTAFAHSCNTAFTALSTAFPPDALASAAQALGLNTVSPDDQAVAGEPVQVQANAELRAADAIGQGGVLTNPLGMARVAASIVAGKPVQTRRFADATPAETSDSLDDGHAQALRSMMRGAVTDGTAGILKDVPGEPVGAKTGTAEVGGKGDHAWMIAIQGDLAVCVFVENGGAGSTVAGPLMKDFLTRANLK